MGDRWTLHYIPDATDTPGRRGRLEVGHPLSELKKKTCETRIGRVASFANRRRCHAFKILYLQKTWRYPIASLTACADTRLGTSLGGMWFVAAVGGRAAAAAARRGNREGRAPVWGSSTPPPAGGGAGGGPHHPARAGSAATYISERRPGPRLAQGGDDARRPALLRHSCTFAHSHSTPYTYTSLRPDEHRLWHSILYCCSSIRRVYVASTRERLPVEEEQPDTG
ncbi:hypothetical protein EVAR_78293_1 [Eumeta japonica]|uniref:Uncharacterized protein n=1 Tax=Eumeta variegata TaxID=151549 RepID=A0A4C1T3Z8_EUMVA|nr:hypothetical protein EVAR_78293_1 [Eumeta japonica]